MISDYFANKRQVNNELNPLDYSHVKAGHLENYGAQDDHNTLMTRHKGSHIYETQFFSKI